MIRLAFILQVIFGLIIGPNACCCTGHRIVGLFWGDESHTDSCCASDHEEVQVASVCCSECSFAPAQKNKSSRPSSQLKNVSCCSPTHSCLCVGVIRPSIHRLQVDIDPVRMVSENGNMVEWLGSELASSVLLGGTTLRSDLSASDHPSRECAIAYQRWNC